MKRKWIVLLCAAAFAACSKEPNSRPEPGGTVPIELSAGIQDQQAIEAPIDGSTFPEMAPAFFLTATQGTGGTAPTDWTSPYFSDKEVNSAADGVLSWPEGQKRYYPADKRQKLYFYAYTPRPASVTAGTQTDAPRINYTIDGSQDIMWAANTEGINPDGATADPVQLDFSHRLMQVRFLVAKDESFHSGEDETFAVTTIKIKDVRTSAILDLGTGALIFPESEPKGTLTVYDDPTGIALGDGAQVPGSVMFGPHTSFTCEVTAGGKTYPNVEVTLSDEGAGTAGTGHIVILTFKRDEISAIAMVVPWTDGDDGMTGDGSYIYPLVMGGNTLVVKDGFDVADPVKYPTHEPWTKTPAHSEKYWDTNASGLNTVGEKFRVARADAKGKDGSAEGMNWFEAAGVTDATYNPDGYSACAAYSEEKDGSDKGQWRLPTIRELKLICDKNDELTSANLPSYLDYWSATENSNTSGLVWCADILMPYNNNKNRKYTNVRCVRDLGLPLPPVSAGYPKTEGGNTLVVKDEFDVADPVKYPTHEAWLKTPAHAESAWDANESGKNTYGKKFRVARADAKGKDGSAVEITWYEAAGVTDATNNPDGYSACAAYSEEADRSDLGLWRLPTVRELKLIYDKKDELTSANLPSDLVYWSATEYSSNGYYAWYVTFGNGVTGSYNKSDSYGRVRCVRDAGAKLPPPPVSADYPKTEGGNTLVVQDDDGMADPGQYPTHEAWTKTPVHAEPAWDANESGLNTYGKKFRVAKANAKGKDGKDERMNWFEAVGEPDVIYNPDGYSACAVYNEEADRSDKGLWRLPTMRELKLIFDKRGKLTSANLSFGTKHYWSTTQFSRDRFRAWYVGINYEGTIGISYINDGSFRVRCVRDL